VELVDEREFFRDLNRQLKKEKFPNWKDLMWGAAIKICMSDNGYLNTCVSKRGRQGDLQMIETAKAPACWELLEVTEAAPPPPTPAHVPTPEPELPVPERTPSMGPPLPPMSPADLQQYQEDLSFISQPVRLIGDNEGGKKEFRLAQCGDYWTRLHHNRPHEVRQILYAIRIWRCMFRAGYSSCQCDAPTLQTQPS
jgi:hypothetical protein